MGFVDAESRISSFIEKDLIAAAKLNDTVGVFAAGKSVAQFGRQNMVSSDSFWVAQNINLATLRYLTTLVKSSFVGLEGIMELTEISELLKAQGYDADRIIIDPSVVRGLGYYTGPVFEAELTFEIQDEKGRTRNFGSVAGGGRYDDLVKRFTGQEVPATGVSIGVDRLLAALDAKGRLDKTADGPVVVTVMDKARMADYQAMVADLRQAGIRAEVYLGNPKNFGNQLKYADKRGSAVAIIQGADEHEKGVVQIKDLILGAKIAENATHEEWKDLTNQYEVPRDQMVAKVLEILALYR
jgi:histidyl-tRNA synthetase